MIWTVPKIWPGSTCWILGGGLSWTTQFNIPKDLVAAVVHKKAPPSVYSDFLSPIHKERVIGVNNAYLIGAWIDALFFGDCSWYLVHRTRLADWPGIKVTCCNRFEKKRKEDSESIHYLHKEKRYGISKHPSSVCWNANSGAAAISLAVHFGATRIILLGFDMHLTKVGELDISHYHGSHGNGPVRKINKKTVRPPFKRHMRCFPHIAKEADKRDITILNASPESNIKAFKKINVEEVL